MNWIDFTVIGVNFFLTIIGVVVTLAISWGKFDKRLSLMHQRLDIMETNHLAHVEADMKKLREDYTTVRESQIRIEEMFKNLKA